MSTRVSIAGLAIILGLVSMMVAPVAAAGGAVNVYYAASLKALNDNSVGPAFQSKTGYTYQGFPNNSGLIVNELKAHLINPDAVEFADASLNSQLMGTANGNIVKWYITFARTHLVIGFNPNSKFAPMFRKVQQHKLAWYKPLLAKGLKFGRTDPNSDPKGYRVIFSFNLAQKLFGLKNFTTRVLGPIKRVPIRPVPITVAASVPGSDARQPARVRQSRRRRLLLAGGEGSKHSIHRVATSHQFWKPDIRQARCFAALHQQQGHQNHRIADVLHG